MAAETPTEEAGVGSILDHFSEVDEVRSLISALPSIYNELRPCEAGLERWTVIMDKYQEQPHLVDPFIEEFIQSLFAYVRDPSTPPMLFHQTFKYLYFMTKMRGAKVIIRWFSHEVSDLEFVLMLLEAQDIRNHDTWETRYILLLWLSIIVIVPFDLSRFDGVIAQKQSGPSQRVADRIVELSKKYLCVPDKSQDAGALMVAKFMSRPDQQKERLPDFIDWCLMLLNTLDMKSMSGMTTLSGVLGVLGSLFKCGKREDLLPYAGTVLKHLLRVNLTSHHNTKLRKLNAKLAQRLAMTFLPPKIAAWRYQRGNRSLLMNLDPQQFSADTNERRTNREGDKADEDEGYDIPEETEEVVGLLLDALKDKDTIVRWSAAKGVGRITGRLPKELGDEIVGSVLELCAPLESDGAWHGACLALAELGRRGLLLPQRLEQVVPIIMMALVYDEKQGSNSLGSHVRDAACYVCWSFARAYSPEVLAPHVHQIACGLLITTVFDREVNCRRAASAAFQENVGRQGTFPHGIDILTTADYFAVGNRTNTYLEISKFIARYNEYTLSLINHLLEHKVSHWDSAVRELAAQSLHRLTELDPEYMKTNVLPVVLSQVLSSDIAVRHGSVLAVAELTQALTAVARSDNKTMLEYLGEDIVSALKAIPGKLDQANYIRGISGEFMRSAVLMFIEKMAVCHMVFNDTSKDTNQLKTWQNIIDENLANPIDETREVCVATFVALCQEYYSTCPAVAEATQNTIIRTYLHDITVSPHFMRMGVSLALGSLPKVLLQGVLKPVVMGLAQLASAIHDPDTKLTEARRDAVIALTRICGTVDVDPGGSADSVLNAENLDAMFDAMLTALRDYTTDSRGDVGTLVREAAMSGLESIVKIVLSKEPSLVTPLLVTQIFQNLVQQSNEKIDRTRAIACEKFVSLLHSQDPMVPHVPHRDELLRIFNADVIKDVNWKVPQVSFPFTVALVSMESYTYHCLLGLVVSVGGLTESTVRYSTSSLLGHLKGVSKDKEALEKFCDVVLEVFRKNAKDPRVIVPLFKTIDILLTNGVFDMWTEEENSFPFALLTLSKEEIAKSKDMTKLLASVSVFCGLLQFRGDTKQKAFSQLMIFLCHMFPRVRRAAADQLYMTLLTFDDIIADAMVGDQVAAILTESVWEDPLDIIRPERNRICSLLEIPQPVIKSKGVKKKKEVKDELASYKDLVDRAGY